MCDKQFYFTYFWVRVWSRCAQSMILSQTEYLRFSMCAHLHRVMLLAWSWCALTNSELEIKEHHGQHTDLNRFRDFLVSLFSTTQTMSYGMFSKNILLFSMVFKNLYVTGCQGFSFWLRLEPRVPLGFICKAVNIVFILFGFFFGGGSVSLEVGSQSLIDEVGTGPCFYF